jgi:hypothetical protein
MLPFEPPERVGLPSVHLHDSRITTIRSMDVLLSNAGRLKRRQGLGMIGEEALNQRWIFAEAFQR